jgi:hypothetical protein
VLRRLDGDAVRRIFGSATMAATWAFIDPLLGDTLAVGACAALVGEGKTLGN